MTANAIDIIWAAICIVVMGFLCGCQTPRTSYMNGVIFWGSTSAIGIGYGEYIEVAPGGKVDRKIKGEKDTLHLAIDNGEVRGAAKETGQSPEPREGAAADKGKEEVK